MGPFKDVLILVKTEVKMEAMEVCPQNFTGACETRGADPQMALPVPAQLEDTRVHMRNNKNSRNTGKQSVVANP